MRKHYSQFHYRFRRGDEILMEDVVNNKMFSQPVVSQHKSKSELRNFYTANLVEALSPTFKTNIEIIVEDIDLYIDGL